MSAQRQGKQRVVVVGLGDTGTLSAMELAGSFEVIGISPKPCLLSGQELGLRLAAPERWKKHYLLGFDRFKRFDAVKRVQAQVTSIDPQGKLVTMKDASGDEQSLRYDALLIASGVSNGFWREPSLQDLDSVQAKLQSDHESIAASSKIAVLGAGGSAVACAANIARTWPDKSVHLFYRGEQVLRDYHAKTRVLVERRLLKLGVHLHPGHQALIPPELDLKEMSRAPVQWSSGQAPSHFDLVLWAIGKLLPNSSFLPASMKNQEGFVRVDRQLRVLGHDDVFAVGDIADSDPLRCSARNWGHKIAAHNIAMALSGRPEKMKTFVPSPHRWGSIFGAQPNGLEVYSPKGRRFRVPHWLVESLIFPLFVDRMIYGGLRKPL